MLRAYVKNNINLIAILIFFILFTSIALLKPNFLFDKDGSIRQFGLGFKNKTIIPLWLVSIILGILAYFLVLYFISAPKLKYF